MAELDQLIGPEDIVVADASYSSIWVANYLTAKRAGQRFLTPRGIAGLGWGLPMAIGAQIAAPDRQGVSASAAMAASPMSGRSWRRCGGMELPITTVLNNGILGYQKHAEEVKFGEHTKAVNFTAVDHAAIARACGVGDVRLEHGGEIRGAGRGRGGAGHDGHRCDRRSRMPIRLSHPSRGSAR